MNFAHVALLACLAWAGVAAGEDTVEVTFDGRTLRQLRPVGFGPLPIPPTPSAPGSSIKERPAPEGGTIDDWTILKSGQVKGAVNRVFDRIEDPAQALVFAFGDLIYSSEKISSTLTKLILNSGQSMVLDNTDSGISRPGLYHLFKITEFGDQIIKAGDTSVSVVGSQMFVQISGVISTSVEVGWLGVYNPSSFNNVLDQLFEGIMEELVDRFKSVFFGSDCEIPGPESVFRDWSGVCNNIDKPYGSAGAKLFRVGSPDFGNGANSPGGSTISARHISNIVCREDSSSDDGSNAMRLTDMFVYYGQFLDHDIGISPVGSFARRQQPLFAVSFEKFLEELPIEIPSDDPDFTTKTELPFERAVYVRENNEEVLPREIVNEITAYFDLSQVYGSTASRGRALRSFVDGKMKTSGSDFLPFNGDTAGGIGISLENAPDPTTRFYVAGDIRAQENVNLLALHTIWLREHNLVASELKAQFGFFTDEELYQTARAICIAEYQSILYTEWLPLLLGSDSPSPSGYSYNSGIDASADAFFTTASFRFGHSMISGRLWRVDAGSQTPSATASLRDVFFAPEALTPSNIDSWTRGMALHEAREADEKVVDDLRSFLFTDDGAPSQDLIALNIQRARDMGVPTYNKARAAFGLSQVSSFSSISDNAETVANLEEAYGGDIDAVDSFVGGLAETKPAGRLFGDLFHESIKEQFQRSRDGDRYFYKGQTFDIDVRDGYSRLGRILNDGVKFIEILGRNTGVSQSDIGSRPSPFQL